MNKVESESRIRDAKTDLEISKIRAEERLVNEQANADAVVRAAAQILSPNARPEEMEEDWLFRVTNKIKVVTDADMQSLWAKIIAGEAEAPGRFSYRVIEEISMLSKREANSFTELAGYVWTSPQIGRPFIVTDDENHPLWRPSSPLKNTNLIKHTYPAMIAYFNEDEVVGELVYMEYYGRRCTLKLKKGGVTFSKGIDLTRVGEVLFPLCGGKPILGEYERVVERWTKESKFDVVLV